MLGARLEVRAPHEAYVFTSFCSSPTARKKLSAGVDFGIDQAMEAEAVLQRQDHGARPRRVGDIGSGQDLRDQGAPGPQALGELGPAAGGAGGEQDQLHVQERRAAQRIVAAALGGAQGGDEVRQVAMARQQVAVMLERPFDVVLQHGDDQLVLVVEIRIEGAARQAGGSRDRLDAGRTDTLLLEHLGGGLEQLFPRFLAGRSGPYS